MKRGFLFVFLLLSYSVSALLISPADLEIKFVPNTEADCSFIVMAKKSTDLLVYAKGELNQSISFSKDKIKAVPGEWNSVECKINMPSDIKPGLNKNFFGVVEDTGETGMVGGISGVELILYIRNPYPGKYLELEEFKVNDAGVNEDVNFLINVINRGEEKINDAYASIDIYDKDKRIDSVITNHIEIENTGKFVATWRTNKADKYNAIAKINYDGLILEESKKFNVGELLIKIVDVPEISVKQNEVAKFDITVQSYWNEIINDVYLDLNVIGTEINSKTEFIKLDPWESRKINGFLETSDLKEGEYEIDVVLHYNDKISREKTKLIITKRFGLPLTTILIIGAMILIILFIINLVTFKKKWKRK